MHMLDKHIMEGDTFEEWRDCLKEFIKDINPQAKVHLIAIPTSHVPYIDMMTEEGTILLGKIMGKISHMQEELGISADIEKEISAGSNFLYLPIITPIVLHLQSALRSFLQAAWICIISSFLK